MDIIVYTCMSGDYDDISNYLNIDPCDKFVTHRMKAKLPKILPHKVLPEHDYSIWVDSNVTLKKTPEQLLEYFEYPDVGVFRHPVRKTINDEIDICNKWQLDNEKNLLYHMDKEGKLAWCGIIIRKNTHFVHAACEGWWAEICAGSSRDQISFPYTLGKLATYKGFLGDETQFFTYIDHKGRRNQ